MRSEFFVSICAVWESTSDDLFSKLKRASDFLTENYRYFEIVVIAERSDSAWQLDRSALAGLRNIRVLMAEAGTPYFRKRALCAAEAIGDVVAIVDFAETDLQGISHAVDECFAANRVMIGQRAANWKTRILYGLVSAFARHNVSSRAARTIILPRQPLNAILSGRNSVLDLRFEPNASLHRYMGFPLTGGRGTRIAMVRRLELVSEIIMSAAPRYLKVFSALSAVVFFFSVLYGAYSILALALVPDIQEGWFSTAISQAGLSSFLALGIGIICLALAALYEQLTASTISPILEEYANVNIFPPEDVVARNVEVMEKRTPDTKHVKN